MLSFVFLSFLLLTSYLGLSSNPNLLAKIGACLCNTCSIASTSLFLCGLFVSGCSHSRPAHWWQSPVCTAAPSVPQYRENAFFSLICQILMLPCCCSAKYVPALTACCKSPASLPIPWINTPYVHRYMDVLFTVYNKSFTIVSLNCRGWFALNIVFTVYYTVFVFLHQPSFRLSFELHAAVNQVLDQCSWSLSACLTALFQTGKI